MYSIDPVPVAPEAVDALKTYLRIESDEEDALLAGLLTAAIRHGEGFTGQIFLRRSMTDRIPVSPDWQRLRATPVQVIASVTGLPAEGPGFALAPPAYAIDIDRDGDGWVRVPNPGAAGRIDVTFTAGIATDWEDLAETLRHAVLRLAAHLHAVRDDPNDPGPPAIVAALWRPWRRMRLG